MTALVAAIGDVSSQPGVVVGALFITSAMQEVIFSSAFVCVFVCVFAVADTSRYTCQRGFGVRLT
jgi:hypothetical protein